MVVGARKVYFGDEIGKSDLVMVLWTIIDRKIYAEVKHDPLVERKMREQTESSLRDWSNLHLEQVVSDSRFPKKIQFWTRFGNDLLDLSQYEGRIDLQHPQMWWDNHQS